MFIRGKHSFRVIRRDGFIGSEIFRKGCRVVES